MIFLYGPKQYFKAVFQDSPATPLLEQPQGFTWAADESRVLTAASNTDCSLSTCTVSRGGQTAGLVLTRATPAPFSTAMEH